MLEHHQHYSLKFDVPKNNLDYFVEIGKAKVLRQGKDITVLSYSASVDLCMAAAEQLASSGIDAEVIDLRTVSPNDIDYETIGKSLKKTARSLTKWLKQRPKQVASVLH